MNGKAVCMNIYDTRLVDDWPACGMNWPPDLPDLYKYLRVSWLDVFSKGPFLITETMIALLVIHSKTLYLTLCMLLARRRLG